MIVSILNRFPLNKASLMKSMDQLSLGWLAFSSVRLYADLIRLLGLFLRRFNPSSQ
jgi:hypothetical protein